jgi:hypothetical protein
MRCDCMDWIELVHEQLKIKGKAIPVTGREGPIGLWDVEASSFSRQLAPEGDEVLSPLTPRKIPGNYFS